MGNWLHKAGDLYEQGRPHAHDTRRRAAAGVASALEWSGERLTKVPAVERVVASKELVQQAQTTYDLDDRLGGVAGWACCARSARRVPGS